VWETTGQNRRRLPARHARSGIIATAQPNHESMPIRNASWYSSFALHVSIFSSLMAIVLSVLYCASRIGFVTNYSTLLRVTGLALLILNVAPFGRTRWFSHAATLVLCTLAAVGVVSWFMETSSFLGWLWAGSGFLLFAWNLVVWLSSFKRTLGAHLLLVFAAMICGLYASGRTWGLGYNHPLAEERLLVNHGHIDALFHASISNMMRTYGQASTGLDGLPYIAYHYGSHWLVAALAPIIGQSVFEFYNSGTAILFIPLMYAALLLLAGVIRDAVRDPVSTDYGFPAGFLFWVVIISGLLGPFPKKGDMMRVSLMEIYVSDSYALGLAVSFLVIALVILFYREWKQSGFPSNAPSGFALFIVFPALYCVCAILKISLAYLLFCMALYASVRLGLWRHRFIQLHLLVSTAALLLLSRFIATRADARLSFFTFDRIHPEWIPFFLIAYFLWVWGFLALRVYQLKLKTMEDVRKAFWRGDLFPVEMLGFCTLIGLFPYLVLRFETGSWNYFTQYQTFLGLALTAGFLPSWPSSLELSFHKKLDQISVRGFFVGAFIFLFLLHLGITTFASAYGLLRLNAEVRAELTGHVAEDWRGLLKALYGTSRGSISPSLQSRRDMLACLHTLAEMPRAKKRATVLYIPKSNRAYWGDLRQAFPSEGAVAFIAPALTGMAMIQGEPEFEDLSATRRLDYGFWSYPMPTGNGPAATIDLAEVSTRARALGSRQLIVMEDRHSGSCEVRMAPL
jgi:hypothetical protein